MYVGKLLERKKNSDHVGEFVLVIAEIGRIMQSKQDPKICGTSE